MASNTPNLNLYKKDPVTDGEDTFNIETMLNENWDKIDGNIEKKIVKATTAPTSPVVDDLWLDTSASPNILKRFDGTEWVNIGKTPPVTSVNNKTGSVTLTAADVGAADEQTVNAHLADIATPTKLGHVKAETDSEGNLILPEVKVDNATVFLNNNGELSTKPNSTIFYWDGDESEEVTGGWIEGYSLNSGTQNKGTENLYLYANDASGAAERNYVTNNLIDLTFINTLYLKYNRFGAGSKSIMSVGSSKNGSADLDSVKVQKYNDALNDTLFLDVSTLQGGHYIKVCTRDGDIYGESPSELFVYGIWGEA